MSKRDREIRKMIEWQWEEEERKQRRRVTLSESDLRLLEKYYQAGIPYGDTPEGFNRWLEERL